MPKDSDPTKGDSGDESVSRFTQKPSGDDMRVLFGMLESISSQFENQSN